MFGRRGSGKTSLLAKAAADLTIERRPIAFVNLETFKGHSYPDVLLSVLIEAFGEFKRWLETAATNPASKTTFWARFFGKAPTRPPLDRKKVQVLVSEIEELISKLTGELLSTDLADRTEMVELSTESEGSVEGKASVRVAGVQGAAGAATKTSSKERTQATEQWRRSKTDFLLRNILTYQQLFWRIAEVSGGDAFLFLDDLYHIRRDDQPNVLDYFHRVAKSNSLWLKVGTIRHRTEWYRHSDPPIGVKLGDDAEEIDLDLIPFWKHEGKESLRRTKLIYDPAS